MSEDRILVTAAAGNVGREVVRALREKGASVVAADRAPERLATLFGEEVARVRLDFTAPSTFGAALRDVARLFLLRPPPISDVGPTLNAFVDAARGAGARHVVFLSVAGADTNRIVPHHRVEQHLFARGDDWTILRPGFFAQNLEDAYLLDIREDDRLYVPAGRGRVAFVDVRDLADVAATALVDPDAHRRAAYRLTGPEAVTFDEVARLLGGELGRTIQYVPASVLGYALHLRRRGLPAPQIAVQTVLHVGLRFGQAEVVDTTLARVLGRAPRTMRDYVRDRAALFRRGT